VWADNSFVTETLPAVARRGRESSSSPYATNDGGRGYPNLVIEVRDRNDRTLQKIALMTSNEYEAMAPGGKPTAELVKRIDCREPRAQKSLHALHDLVPMKSLEMQKPADGSDQHFATGDNLDVDWNVDHPPRVSTTTSSAPRPPVDGHRWLAPPHPFMFQLQHPVRNPDVFSRGLSRTCDQRRRRRDPLTHGTDTCEEPGDQPTSSPGTDRQAAPFPRCTRLRL